ncbi:hypothetical protein CYMTET_25459 [Cymbomonas tetramitiformis]|uniref:Kinesin-like protein n=1 Tax=Cymbomonas tetramitiformis TaxID=36881 RepID=A0AAE0FU58_9CHLO|nr:hypothetical protein CYMTET_25459 [Cymbomonas tetramitiformis]
MASGGDGEQRSIRVVVRCRPPQPHEAGHTTSSLKIEDGNLITLNNPGGHASTARRSFPFDAVLDSDSSQEEMHSAVGVQEVVQQTLSGYHATVFAYGQTGSGKTFTMEGFDYDVDEKKRLHGSAPTAKVNPSSDKTLGIVPTAITLLFDEAARMREESPGREFSIKVSFVQIYKEQVYDLLSPNFSRDKKGAGSSSFASSQKDATSSSLKMRWTKADGFFLENLFTSECKSAADVLAFFKAGVKNKVMASHRMNMASSRSHSLFTLHVSSHMGAGQAADAPLSSKMTLVDLAGSERAALTGGGTGSLMQESIFINKSLFTLRKVIQALSEARYKGLHVPYRPGATARRYRLYGHSRLARVESGAGGATAPALQIVRTQQARKGRERGMDDGGSILVASSSWSCIVFDDLLRNNIPGSMATYG